MDATAMARGEPGLPGRFVWNQREYAVAQVLRVWKTSSRGLCGEMYLRRHWYEVQTTSGLRMTLYCERQAKHPKKPMRRWWIYSIDQPADPGEA
jgi:hypothetical protein